jgi:hypothetical protein
VQVATWHRLCRGRPIFTPDGSYGCMSAVSLVARPVGLGEAGRPRNFSPGVGSTAIVLLTAWISSSMAVCSRLGVIHAKRWAL